MKLLSHQPRIIKIKMILSVSQDSAVSIAKGYRLDGQGVRVRIPIGARFFFSPHHPYWFWRPLSLLSNGYQGLFL
jgi:hypothetical protein